MTSTLTPTTMTKNAQVIVQTSADLWEMYVQGHRLMNYGAVIISNGAVTDIADFPAWFAGGGVPDWAALAADFGLATPEQAASLFDLMVKAFGQINAEEINGAENFLRTFMHKVG
jgi:hypothetical protein